MNIESLEPVGIFKALWEAFKAVFGHFGSFLKMSFSVVWFIASSVVTAFFLALTLTVFFQSNSFGSLVSGFYWCLGFTLLSLVLTLVAGWKYILSFIAASYLAKDIYENKPVQKTEQYFKYVEPYSKSYICFLLLFCALTFVVTLALFVVAIMWVWIPVYVFFDFGIPEAVTYTSIALTFLSWLFIGTWTAFSFIYWAYNDKQKPGSLVVKSFYFPFKNPKAFLFYAILGIPYLIIQELCTAPLTVLFGGYVLILFLFMMIFALFYTYFCVYATTRYYFSLIKK